MDSILLHSSYGILYLWFLADIFLHIRSALGRFMTHIFLSIFILEYKYFYFRCSHLVFIVLEEAGFAECVATIKGDWLIENLLTDLTGEKLNGGSICWLHK